MLKINAGSYSFEAANPRHEHEYHLFERVNVPEGKVLCPGVITHASNIVEHPELIAERPDALHHNWSAGKTSWPAPIAVSSSASALPNRSARDRRVGKIQGHETGCPTWRQSCFGIEREQAKRRDIKMLKQVLLGSAMLALAASSAAAQQKEVKIGFVTTFSGGTAAVGNETCCDAFELALDQPRPEDERASPVQVVYEDDGLKPEVGKQKTDKLIESEKVNFLTGYMMSHILLASIKSAVDLGHLPDQCKRGTVTNRGRGSARHGSSRRPGKATEVPQALSANT